MAKTKKAPLEVLSGETTLELHVAGDLLGHGVFLDILDVLKKNKDSEMPKNVRFVVFSAPMLQMIRYSIPSEYYAALEIRNPNYAAEKDVLKDAAGL